jgi:predicted solute-binding protein
MTFRIGSVHYLNALPLTRGLGTDLVRLAPSRLATELHAGRLDAALLSITEALFHPSHEILDGIGILSRGPVFSVGLAHRQPLDQIQRIHLDPASCTSVNLLRVLLHRRGLHPTFESLPSYSDAPSLDNTLLIGNPAIDFRRQHPDHPWWDLGQAWFESEQLPFTYAVWVLRQGSDSALRQLLRDSALRGAVELPDLIRESSEYDAPFRTAYLGGHVQYDLDAPARDGIRRFAQQLRGVTDREVYDPRFVN